MEFSQLNLVKTNDSKQWYMTVEDVAKGYGVEPIAIRCQLSRHADELRNGMERGVAICNTLGGPQEAVVLYRDGVIKLGFFVRSQQAKIFRQWATEVVCEHMDKKGLTLENLFDAIQDLQETSRATQAICQGFRDEIDELKATLQIFISDSDATEIRLLIKRVKAAKEMDGRAIVGHVRKTLNVGSIYGTPDVGKVKNVLKNMLGEGLTLLK